VWQNVAIGSRDGMQSGRESEVVLERAMGAWGVLPYLWLRVYVALIVHRTDTGPHQLTAHWLIEISSHTLFT
jgi:hypothetical protein